MISVNLLDKLVPVAPPPELDAPNRRAKFDFDRSLRDATSPPRTAPPEKPEPKPARPSDAKDVSDTDDPTVAEAARIVEPAPTQNAQSEPTVTPADTPEARHAPPQSVSVVAAGTPPATDAPISNTALLTEVPAAPTSSAVPATLVNDATTATSLPQFTPATVPIAEAIQSDAPPVAESRVPLVPVPTDPAKPLPAPVGLELPTPAPQQPNAARTADVASFDDDSETPDPDSPPRPPSIDYNPTRLRSPVADAPGGDALRDAVTRQQTRQHHVDASAAREARTPDVQTTTPFPAHSAGGATSPAVELARALLPEAGLNDLPAPTSLGSDATPASSAAQATALGSANGQASTQPSIRGATVVDAHDSGGGFRLDAGGPATSASSVDRLTQVLSSSVTPRSSFLRLQLDPPELGQLRIEVRMNQDSLSMRVQTETAAVKGLVEERMGELKAAMHQQGIRVDRVDVEVKPQSGTSSHGREHGDARDPGAREHAAAWDRPRDASDWQPPADEPRRAFDADAGAVDGIGASLAANDFHLVTTESSVDVLI